MLGAAPKIARFRDIIVEIIPSFHTSSIDNLVPFGVALHCAYLQHLRLQPPKDVLEALAEEGMFYRDLLRTDALPLQKRGLLSQTCLQDLTMVPGYKEIGTDVGLLVTVYRSAWTGIENKCAIVPADLDRAEKVSWSLLRYVGLREVASEGTREEAADPS